MEISLTFIKNITLIITFIYLLQKVKILVLKSNKQYLLWGIPVLYGILSVLIMLQPFNYMGLRFDMRSIPIFLAAYIGGWRAGLISLIIPLAFRLSIGGPGMFSGILNALILAALIGSLFRDHKLESPISPIRYQHLLSIFFIFQFITLLTGFYTLKIPILVNIQFKAALLVFSLAALTIIVLILNDTNKQFALQKKFEHLSNHDPMTNLPNLRYLKVEAKSSLTEDQLVCIAMVDIDHFKLYNDTHGHPAGDDIIRSVGQLLTDNAEPVDLVARYGGEEFIILFRGRNDSTQIVQTAYAMMKAVEQFPFKGRESQPEQRITISIGISLPSLGRSLNELIEEADNALYVAKKQGRNRLVLYKTDS
jgi:diguanylate cyclase